MEKLWMIVTVEEEFCSCQFLFVAVASAAAINKGLLLPMTSNLYQSVSNIAFDIPIYKVRFFRCK